MYHKTPPPSPEGVMAVRPEGAIIARQCVLDLCNIAVQLDELLHLKGLEATTAEQWGALWCADVVDTFGMLDDWQARLGLDAAGLKVVRVGLFELMSAEDSVETLAEIFGANVREALGEANLSRVQFANLRDPQAASGAVCHSHDYTDANQCMIDAEETLGIEHDAASEEQARFIDFAWNISKARGFASKANAAGYAAFLAAFPQVERDYSTGGGCTAWHIKCARGFILITAQDDPSQPMPSDTFVGVGYYETDDAGEYVDDGEYPDEGLTWAAARDWVRARLTQCERESMAPLIAEFATWTKANGFTAEAGDAGDILVNGFTNEKQRIWLRTFIARWEWATARPSKG